MEAWPCKRQPIPALSCWWWFAEVVVMTDKPTTNALTVSIRSWTPADGSHRAAIGAILAQAIRRF